MCQFEEEGTTLVMLWQLEAGRENKGMFLQIGPSCGHYEIVTAMWRQDAAVMAKLLPLDPNFVK